MIAPDGYTIGIDLIDHHKFETYSREEHPRFYSRVFSPAELKYCRGRIARYAGIFAAKEATYKAISHLGKAFISQIEITHVNRRPVVKDRTVQLEPGYLRVNNTTISIQISISHGTGQSVAIALGKVKD